MENVSWFYLGSTLFLPHAVIEQALALKLVGLMADNTIGVKVNLKIYRAF